MGKLITAMVGVLLLGACASEPPLMSEKGRRLAPGSTWEVTEAAAIEPTTGSSPYLGQKIALLDNRAGDPAGRTCKNPVYNGYEASADLVLGGSGDELSRMVLEVVCEDAVIGTYVTMDDGRLKTRIDNWLLTLSRAAEPAPAPPAVVTITAPPPLAPAPVPASATGRLVYLASYKSEATATTGYAKLSKNSTMLSRLTMATKHVDLGAKGKWIRLFAKAGDDGEAKRLCAELRGRLPDCGMAWAN